MNIIKFLKNIISPNPKSYEPAITEEHKNFSSMSLIIQSDTLPPDILSLLWFADGSLKNYNLPGNSNDSRIDGLVMNVTFRINENLELDEVETTGAAEPSVISINDPIKRPIAPDSIPSPNYYPSYYKLTPEQRYIYLNWLKDIENPINISYVFIFYYGLERHLLLENYEPAFEMVLRLRQFHKNGSFLSYSSAALITSCIIHNRSDLFIRFLNESQPEEIYVSDLYLMAKSSLSLGITSLELMDIASQVGFTNLRYIKNERELFQSILNQLILEKYNNGVISLKPFNLKTNKTRQAIFAANYSIPNEQRILEIPSILENKSFSKFAKELLQEAHNRVKEQIKIIRKNNSTVPAKTKPNIATKTPSDVYKKSILFEEIDVHQLDKNICMYNQGICPYCDNKVKKIPVTKAKCTTCKNTILVNNNEFTGEKIFLTETEYKKMKQIQKERVRRKWIYGVINNHGLDEGKIIEETKKINKTIEEVLIDQVLILSKNHCFLNNNGLYRNSLMEVGDIYERSNNKNEALKYYLIVCWFDFNGASNGGTGFDIRDDFTAPYVINQIIDLSNELELGESDLKKLFIEYSTNNIVVGMPLDPEKAWTKLSKKLEKQLF